MTLDEHELIEYLGKKRNDSKADYDASYKSKNHARCIAAEAEVFVYDQIIRYVRSKNFRKMMGFGNGESI